MLFEYYAIDWAATVVTLLATWWVGNKNINGFILMGVAAVLWTIIGFMANSLAIVITNLAIIVVNARAYFNWARTERSPTT